MLLLLAGSFSAESQTLKDLLYSGKLKKDTSGVLRSTDDLSAKIDTAEKKPAPPAQQAVAVQPAQPAATATSNDAAAKPPAQKTTTETGTATAVIPPTTTTTATEAAAETTPEAPATAAAPAKSNNRIWKEFTDSLVKEMKADIQSNKKIKKESYYVTVEYDIEPTGDVTINNVIAGPENAMLQAVVKDRIMIAPPKMAPVPKKVKRKYNFMVTKE